jgi:hypothetical protein
MDWMGKFWRGLGHVSIVHWLWTLVPAGGLGVVVGISSYLEGFPFSVVILMVLATISIMLFMTNEWRRQSITTKPTEGSTAPAVEAQSEDRKDGLTLTATAVVSDVPEAEQLRRGLYVGQIIFEADKLATEHVIRIVIIGFNGTNKLVSVSRVTGAIHAFVKTGDGDKTDEIILPTPALLTVHSNPENLQKYSEFLFFLEQPLRPSMAERIVEGLGRGRVSFDFDNLKIVMEARSQGISTNIRLWGGVTLGREEGLRTRQIHKIQPDDS